MPEWQWPSFDNNSSRLFVAGPEWHCPRDAMFYTAAYGYYAGQRDKYQSDVLLKGDHDIVYFDLDRLAT